MPVDLSTLTPIPHTGNAGCGKIAFYTSKTDWKVGDPLMASFFYHHDGSQPKPSTVPRCFQCGQGGELRYDTNGNMEFRLVSDIGTFKLNP